VVIQRALKRLLNKLRHNLPQIGYLAYLLQRLMWWPTIALSTFDQTFTWVLDQQKTFLSRRNGCIRVDSLGQSCQRHPGGGLLRARREYHALHCISPSDLGFAISSGSVCLRIWMNTVTLWPTVTIRRNGFIGYMLALGLQCHGSCCENLSLHSFYLRTKCNSIFTDYTHHSKSPDLCGYWESISRSFRLPSH